MKGKSVGRVVRDFFSNLRAHWNRALSSRVDSMKIRIGSKNPLMFAFAKQECQRVGVRLMDVGEYLSISKDHREMRLAQQHFVFAFTFARDFDKFFSPLVPIELDGKQVIDFSRTGVLQTYASSGLQFEMASFPEEEEAISDYFKWYVPQSGDTVFDIGAHCGVSTYHFAKLVGPTGRVIAFEPDPTNFNLLLRNVERHSLANVIPIQVAIAGSREPVAFSCEGTIGSGILRYLGRPPMGAITMVDAITLRDAFERWGPPQFCKIDIEGAELEVIGSSLDLLMEHPSQFVLDTSHMVGRNMTYGRIEAMFRASGYQVESSNEGIKTTWAARNREPLRGTRTSRAAS